MEFIKKVIESENPFNSITEKNLNTVCMTLAIMGSTLFLLACYLTK